MWGPLYYNRKKEPPRIVLGNCVGPYITLCVLASLEANPIDCAEKPGARYEGLGFRVKSLDSRLQVPPDPHEM